MISSFTLKFGPVQGATQLTITPTPITIFVGPNNSGKSRILSEIDQYCASGSKQSNWVILDSMEFTEKDVADVPAAISRVTQKLTFNEILPAEHIAVGSRRGRNHVHLPRLINSIAKPGSDIQFFCQSYVNHSLLKLDGPNRIALVVQQPAGDLQQPQHNTFSVLFSDDAKRLEVRRIIHDAFGLYLVVDPTNLGQFRLRLSERAPSQNSEERGIDDAAVQFHSKAMLIDDASDGVKAFTGIITEAIAGDPGIILVDEPEAFLHPSLAFKLGLELSRAAGKSDKRVLASTHSPSFLMGCIQSGVPINIVRLTYRNGTATARTLPSAEIVALMRNPLLRSTNVLAGLFSEFVVVTEADTDRAFYQEINERLLRFVPEKGIPNCLFLHAQNKQTIPTIVRPLRKLGIPSAAITDVDVLKDGGTVWSNLLDGAGFPEIEKNALASLRASVKLAMDSTGRNMKRDGGLAILSGQELEGAENLIQRLASYGVFVVPGGELECWLTQLGATGHGPTWLIQLFELMGEDSESTGYVKPAEDDVWKFLEDVRGWLVNPTRRGIPS